VNQPVPPLAEVLPDVMPEINDAVLRMLSKDPHERPNSLAEALHPLIEIVRSEQPDLLSSLPFASSGSMPAAPPARASSSSGSQFPAPSRPSSSGGSGGQFPPPPARSSSQSGSRLPPRAATPRPFSTGPLRALDSDIRPQLPKEAVELPAQRSSIDATLPARPPSDAYRSGEKRSRKRIGVALGIAVPIALIVGLVTFMRPEAPPKTQEARVVGLESPDAVLACPIFEASGVEEPSGWLGAAAAATVCERARVWLGGRVERTRVPAELLSLPRTPKEDFPLDPFASTEARKKSLAAAKDTATAYFEGRVEKQRSNFRVHLVLRHRDGRELGKGEGTGVALYQAVREAMAPLFSSKAIPKSSNIEKFEADWLQTNNPDDALARLDVELAMGQDAGLLGTDCASLDPQSLAYSVCLTAQGQTITKASVSDPDRSSPGAFAVWVAQEAMFTPLSPDRRSALAAELSKAFAAEKTPWVKSRLASLESCLTQEANPQRARELALMSVLEEPRSYGGWACSAWKQLLAASLGSPSADSVVRAAQAWMPMDFGPLLAGARDPANATSRMFAERAYALAPFNTLVATRLAEHYIFAGDQEAARSIAVALQTSRVPLHQVASDLILTKIDVSEARFRPALERAMAVCPPGGAPPEDNAFVHFQRLEIAWRAFEISIITNNADQVAEGIIMHFIAPDPPPIDITQPIVPARLAAVCALASRDVSKLCFHRLEELKSKGYFANAAPDTDIFFAGARLYAAKDFKGAARAWRPLLRDPNVLTTIMPDAMANAFEKSGETDLVERLDAPALATRAEFNGANMAMVRAARRAFAKGDVPLTRTLAEKIIEAWSVTDLEVPSVDEMRKLLRRLK
jgi:eukaryotic-like serine/threonine-protein kinase